MKKKEPISSPTSNDEEVVISLLKKEKYSKEEIKAIGELARKYISPSHVDPVVGCNCSLSPKSVLYKIFNFIKK